MLYVTAHRMFAELRAARADNTQDRRLARFTAPDLLIVDDLGLRPLAQDEPVLLYEVIRQRYERGALVVTSNRAIEEWYPLFQDDLLASAALDRFLHHAHVVVMEGRSYRNPRNLVDHPLLRGPVFLRFPDIRHQSGQPSRRPASTIRDETHRSGAHDTS